MSHPSEAFVPPHCPRSDCAYHRCARGWRWARHGTYRRQASPQRIPRFRCGHCLRTFSSQSFSTTYYLKRPELLVPIFAGLQAGSCHRQLARSLGCAPSTVTRQSARLGRHALLLVASSLAADRLRTGLIGGFGALALVLAMSGIYGVFSFLVAAAKRDTGVRMALGAERRRILFDVLRDVTLLASIGILIGILASAGIGRMLETFLHGVEKNDAATLVAVAVAMLAVPVIANVTAEPIGDARRLPALLERQVTARVCWRQSMMTMKALRVDGMVEFGAGKVLTGLAKRALPGVELVNIQEPGDVEAFAAVLA